MARCDDLPCPPFFKTDERQYAVEVSVYVSVEEDYQALGPARHGDVDWDNFGLTLCNG